MWFIPKIKKDYFVEKKVVENYLLERTGFLAGWLFFYVGNITQTKVKKIN